METSNDIIQDSVKREQRKVAMGSQRAKRRAAQTNGGMHAVSHTITRSRTQDDEPRITVSRPEERRWQPASHLPGIPDLPGYSTKWARIHNSVQTNGVGDSMKLAAYLQQGWELARVSDFPRNDLPTTSIARHGDVIGNGDMVLIKIELGLLAQRNAHYNGRRDTAADAINSEFVKSMNDPRVPLVENLVQSGQGIGRPRRTRSQQARVATDD